MNLQCIASKGGRGVVGHNIQSWTKRRKRLMTCHELTREYASGKHSSGRFRDELAREHVRDLSKKQKAKRAARALDRDFFISVLGSSATKRDARAYLKAFTPTKESIEKKTPIQNPTPSKCNSVNLGGFYGTARAVADSPKFVQQPQTDARPVVEPQLHIALVKIRAPQTLDKCTLDGVGRTLAQLARLGMTSIVVVDCEDGCSTSTNSQDIDWRRVAIEQADRIVAAIDAHAHGQGGGRFVDNVIGISDDANEGSLVPQQKGQAFVTLRKLLMTPLRRGIIPVIPALGYTETTQASVPVHANEVVLALTREFAGVQPKLLPNEDLICVNARMQALRKEVSLDRLIILDPLGGIPASDRENGYHVFLNMEQEFDSATLDLVGDPYKNRESTKKLSNSTSKPVSSWSNPFSRLVKPISGDPHANDEQQTVENSSKNIFHLQNLRLARTVLSMLPATSSALLTTPDEAANSGRLPDTPFQAAGVGTRRQRNPLIHNLLTDKPVFSSSLPVGRIGATLSTTPNTELNKMEHITPTTFAKHGMSVAIFPDPRIAPWTPPEPGKPHLTLTDSHIDLPRLVHLIEDSFDRKLDVKNYLERVNDRIAGVIIAGEYEGGAILTWETPPGVVDDGSPETRARMVPYLDKFAVLKKSQGSGGTADVVFKAMVRDCFPSGVCWRSRKTNVVNKWYFERSRGTWKIPDTGWTMFWTTPDLSLDQQKFSDYEAVCRGVQPSWADNKTLLD